MPARRILFLDSAALNAYLWHKGEVQHEGTFSNDIDGHAEFTQYLIGKHQTLFYLLADIAEEGFQSEELPFVRGKDGHALRQRKLSQYFFGTPLTLAQAQGRASEGRRDEKYIFAALTRPQQFEPWLVAIEAANAPLVGIYSVPFVLPSLLGKVASERQRFILITLTNGGLRQTYFDQGQLRFSRLSLLATSGLEEAAVSAAAEATKIHQYLVGQRLLTRAEKIPVLCLTTANQFEILRRECVDTEELKFELLDFTSVAKSKRFNSALADSHADTLLAHLLASERPGVQFAPEAQRKPFRRWQVRFAINALAGIIVSTSIIFAARMTVDWFLLQQKIELSEQTAAADNQRYETIVRSLPVVPTSPDNLRALISRWQELDQRSPTLAASLAVISRALQANPQIEINRIDWRVASSAEGGPSTNPTNPANPAMGGGNGTYAVADIEAQLPAGLSADRRAQAEIIERFVSALKTDPSQEAKTLDRPFDADSGKALKGSSEKKSGNEALRFTVRYSRKVM